MSKLYIKVSGYPYEDQRGKDQPYLKYELYLYFNNDFEERALRNAKELKGLLEQQSRF